MDDPHPDDFLHGHLDDFLHGMDTTPDPNCLSSRASVFTVAALRHLAEQNRFPGALSCRDFGRYAANIGWHAAKRLEELEAEAEAEAEAEEAESQ